MQLEEYIFRQNHLGVAPGRIHTKASDSMRSKLHGLCAHSLFFTGEDKKIYPRSALQSIYLWLRDATGGVYFPSNLPRTCTWPHSHRILWSFCQVCFNFLIRLMCGILKIIIIIIFSSACCKFEFQFGVSGNVFLLKELSFRYWFAYLWNEIIYVRTIWCLGLGLDCPGFLFADLVFCCVFRFLWWLHLLKVCMDMHWNYSVNYASVGDPSRTSCLSLIVCCSLL